MSDIHHWCFHILPSCNLPVLKFIEAMCACKLPMPANDPVLEVWQGIVDTNLSHTEDQIRVSRARSKCSTYQIIILQECAVSAFSGLCDSYYGVDHVICEVQGTVHMWVWLWWCVIIS